MLQLKESLDQRMGCVIVGPCGCGKSSVWGVLRVAMIKCGQVCDVTIRCLQYILMVLLVYLLKVLYRCTLLLWNHNRMPKCCSALSRL
jgi:hypothetical protein